jgi:hypothetical protein
MIEQANVNPAVAGPTANRLVPGYLFTPFGWAGHYLAAMVDSEPGLWVHIFELDRPRMHLIALALAHLDCELTPELASFFLLARLGARCPTSRAGSFAYRHQTGSVASAVRCVEPAELSTPRTAAR